MILGIDASNLRSGGGITHLKGILSNVNPLEHGINKVIIWSNTKTLSELPNNDWLIKKTHIFLNKSFLWSFFFQFFLISKHLKNDKCDLLFVPGGTFIGGFNNFVSMCRNMLPFEKEERNRYTQLKTRLRFRILKITQSITFKRSKGVVFLTNYAKEYVTKSINLKCDTIIIPHGIDVNFINEPKNQNGISFYNKENPFRLLYVSLVTVYKHQWNVAEAVIKLKNDGYSIVLDLVGDYTPESLIKLNEVLKKDFNNVVNFKGLVKHENLSSIYKSSDGFIFASSCENMPNILVEAMTAGLPIACSNKGPMPEVLGSNGFYFDPLNVKSIYDALKKLLENEKLRSEYSKNAFDKSINYTWKECANSTFQYLALQIKNNKR